MLLRDQCVGHFRLLDRNRTSSLKLAEQQCHLGFREPLLEQRVNGARKRLHCSRSGCPAFVKIGKYQGYPFINGLDASQLRFVMARRLSAATAIGTFEVAFLIEHHAELFLETHAAQQSVERFAACNAVSVVTRSAIGNRNKVLDAGIGRQQDVIAEEAQPALGEQQSVNRFAARSAHLLIGSLLLRERRLSTLRAL